MTDLCWLPVAFSRNDERVRELRRSGADANRDEKLAANDREFNSGEAGLPQRLKPNLLHAFTAGINACSTPALQTASRLRASFVVISGFTGGGGVCLGFDLVEDVAHGGGIGIFGREFQEFAQMVGLGGAVALLLVDFGEQEIDLALERVIALFGGKQAALFRRVELAEMKVSQTVVVESRRRFVRVRVDDLIGEIGNLRPLFLVGRDVREAEVGRQVFRIGLAGLCAGLLSFSELAGFFLRLPQQDPGFGIGGIGFDREIEVLERFVRGLLARSVATAIKLLTRLLGDLIVFVFVTRGGDDGVHRPVKAGWHTGKRIRVIAIKLGFLSSGVTNIRVNAHGVAIGATTLGEERRERGEHEGNDEDRVEQTRHRKDLAEQHCSWIEEIYNKVLQQARQG